MMRKLVITAFVYCLLGLASGVYYREFTKLNDFTGDTQLSVLHTHLLMLGMFMFLIVLLLEKAFALTTSKNFKWFYYLYNAGVLLMATMFTIKGSLTVLGKETGAALAGISGMTHILLTVGLIYLFIVLFEKTAKKA